MAKHKTKSQARKQVTQKRSLSERRDIALNDARSASKEAARLRATLAAQKGGTNRAAMGRVLVSAEKRQERRTLMARKLNQQIEEERHIAATRFPRKTK